MNRFAHQREWTVISLCAILAVCIAAEASATTRYDNDHRIPGHYIVALRDSVNDPYAVAQAQAKQIDGHVSAVFHLLNGYAATLPKDAAEVLRRDPRVAYVTADHWLSEQAQIIPTGVSRILAPSNKAIDIDGTDDSRVKVDVAVLDSGINIEQPDLNLHARTSCMSGSCIDGTGNDDRGHGSHVAGTIGAIDNSIGVVGVAPGARLWAVKVLNSEGKGTETAAVLGVEWVTAHANEVEVANMSIGCLCETPSLNNAINASIEAGIVYTVAAGNTNIDAKSLSPANNPNVITVSAITDYNGVPGKTPPGSVCGPNLGLEDSKATYSNYGASIDITAPGSCIESTWAFWPKFYTMANGTSMASAHVAGAAAILASQTNPASKKDVEGIRETLLKAGNGGWTDNSGDGVKEPLLDVSNEVIFKPGQNG